MVEKLGIQESFNNVRIICHNALMKREEWLAIEESLKNISEALQEGMATKARIELLEKQLDGINKNKDKPVEEVPESAD